MRADARDSGQQVRQPRRVGALVAARLGGDIGGEGEGAQAMPEPPTALFVANNHMTIGVMRALNQRGVRVPEDLALTVFDDFEWASIFRPRLTAIAQPIEEIATCSMRLLAERIEDPDRPPRTVRLKPRFMHRDSCGCVR
ncbi:substrate-binding domain-containing protein [Nocardia lasii]|uniref:Substrate-binding domain-containing protein n=1 Tax=Nocardia lasii TaxID=1616107 RepID=A0ABW1JP86_9NOCA